MRKDFSPICAAPGEFFDRIHELYLYEERHLMDSIRRGDRREATRIINLLLVHIYSEGEERSELLKGLLLELIVMMSRAAVEAGASQSELLGLRFQHLTELAGLSDDEQLAGWLRASVERVFDALERRQPHASHATVVKVLEVLRRRVGDPLTRDDVAREVGVSSAHLGELLRERTGRSFSVLLRETRIDRASELLRTSALPISEIAAGCGFCDQSYLTHVFQQSKGMTPRQYRESDMEKTQKIPLHTQDGRD